MRGLCHQAKENRKVYRKARLEAFKEIARQRLMSEQGKEHRGQRCVDVEGSFGQLKHNKGFRRFYLRGLEKIDIEIGLLATSMNSAKLAKHRGKVCPEPSKFDELPTNNTKNTSLRV